MPASPGPASSPALGTLTLAELEARAGDLRAANESLQARIAALQAPPPPPNEPPGQVQAAQREVTTLEGENDELAAQLAALESTE